MSRNGGKCAAPALRGANGRRRPGGAVLAGRPAARRPRQALGWRSSRGFRPRDRDLPAVRRFGWPESPSGAAGGGLYGVRLKPGRHALPCSRSEGVPSKSGSPHDRESARAQRSSPAEKAEVSESAKAKADTKRTPDGLPVHSFTSPPAPSLAASAASATSRSDASRRPCHADAERGGGSGRTRPLHSGLRAADGTVPRPARCSTSLPRAVTRRRRRGNGEAQLSRLGTNRSQVRGSGVSA